MKHTVFDLCVNLKFTDNPKGLLSDYTYGILWDKVLHQELSKDIFCFEIALY